MVDGTREVGKQEGKWVRGKGDGAASQRGSDLVASSSGRNLREAFLP